MFGPIILWFASADFERTKTELIESGKFTPLQILAKENTRNTQRQRLDRTVAALRRRSIKPVLEYEAIDDLAKRTMPTEDYLIVEQNNEAQGAFLSNPNWNPEAIATWTDEVMPFALPEDLAKQVFEFTIELFMWQQFPKAFDPESGTENYFQYIEDNLVDFFCLYASVFLIGLYNHLTVGALYGIQTILQCDEAEDLTDYFLKHAELTPELMEKSEAIAAYKEVLAEEVNELEAKLEAALKEKEKADRAACEEIERQKRRNALLEDEIKALLRELRSTEEESELSEEQESEVDITAAQIFEAAEETGEDIELPRDHVLFLGGHPNMVKRFTSDTRYKKWDFVTSKSDGGEVIPDGDYDVIFIWAGHLSHKIMQQVDRAKPIIYLTATNYTLLEREMKQGYAKALKDRE